MEQLDEGSEQQRFFGINPEKLSNEFIAGLIVGEGSFYWTYSKTSRINVACFALKMQIRDFDLLVNVGYSLGLDDKIYEYNHNSRHYAFLIVRDFEGLRKIISDIYPFLSGYKKIQFVEWFHGFEKDRTKEWYGTIYNIFKNRFPELH